MPHRIQTSRQLATMSGFRFQMAKGHRKVLPSQREGEPADTGPKDLVGRPLLGVVISGGSYFFFCQTSHFHPPAGGQRLNVYLKASFAHFWITPSPLRFRNTTSGGVDFTAGSAGIAPTSLSAPSPHLSLQSPSPPPPYQKSPK